MQSDTIPLPRISASLVLGAAATAALFLLMNDLIRQDGNVPEPAEPFRITDIYRLIEEVPVPPRQHPKPPPPVLPTPPVTMPLTEFAAGGDFDPGFEAPAVDPGAFVPGSTLVDGEMLPIVKVAPAYPSRARSRGMEGYVLVSFTVDEAGRVREPRVVESRPRGVFDRVAVDAVRKFKYRPRVVNGVPVRVSDVLHRLSFELKDS